MLVGGAEPGVITPILKRRLSLDSSTSQDASNKKVAFDHNPISVEWHEVLERVRVTGLSSIYRNQLCDLCNFSTSVQQQWLKSMTASVDLLDKSVQEFVFDLLNVTWKLGESPALCSAYQGFIVSLITAHNFYCKPVLKKLFTLLLPVIPEGQDEYLRINPHALTASTITIYNVALDTIAAIHGSKLPTGEELILHQAVMSRPYYKKHPHILLVYAKCLLLLAHKLPGIRRLLLEIVIHNIVTLDVNTPRSQLTNDEEEEEESGGEENVFQMDVDDHPTSKPTSISERAQQKHLRWLFCHPLAYSLDLLMGALLLYVHCVFHGVTPTLRCQLDLHELHKIGCPVGSVKLMTAPLKKDVCQPCDENKEGMIGAEDREEASITELSQGCQCGGDLHNLDELKKLFVDIREIFLTVVLPTHSCGHVQFIMFYLLAMRTGLTSIFLEHLRTKHFLDQSMPLDVRKNAMAYIGSLLARGKFVPFSLVHSCLEVLVNWCHAYIQNHERDQVNNFESLDLHATFYYACQTVFYVFTFKCRDYTRNSRSLELARNLNLEHLVFSKMNPLAVCTPPIVKNFAAVTRHYQLAYCYAVIENNRRKVLPVSRDVGAGRSKGVSLDGSLLDMFFPFDPYLLPVSGALIDGHYREFSGLPENISLEDGNSPRQNKTANITAGSQSGGDKSVADEEVDDFLDQSSSIPATRFMDFSI